MLVDTHAHLGDPVFDPDRREVLDRAEAVGVQRVVVVAETLDEARRNLALAAEDPRMWPTAGLYPTVLDRDQAAAIEDLLRAERDRFVAVGEVGLDYWMVQDPEQRRLQREIFVRAVRLAGELDLPINIHSRSAGRHAVDLLIEQRARRVHLHAFDGKGAHARRAAEAGFKLSIPPSILRSQQKQKLVRALPLEALMVETDSPVLGPEPGERNEPANAILAIREIARLKGLSEEAVTRAVTANTEALYGQL